MDFILQKRASRKAEKNQFKNREDPKNKKSVSIAYTF